MKDYYDAESGGYTSVTAVEIRKQTFNVKKCIKDVLIDKLGRTGIPSRTTDGNMRFNLSESLATKYGMSSTDLRCKFSKPDKDEITIYFSNADFLPHNELNEGDVWCIFFKEGDNTPWFDYVKKEHWSYMDDPLVGDTLVEPDEVLRDTAGKVELLTYETSNIEDLNIREVPAPTIRSARRSSTRRTRTPHIVSTAEMKKILKNQRIKGVRGEEIVLKIEKDRLTAAGKTELAEKVKWVAKKADGYGYDIESFEFDTEKSAWEKIYIEVKTTSQLRKETPFFVSENERRVSKEKGKSFYIYRVFAMTKSSSDVSYYRINGPIDDNYALAPCSYIATRK